MSDIIKFIEKVLPTTNVSTGIQYNETQNIFHTSGFTSEAGNTYFKGLRLSDRIYIVLDIGIGYRYSFLNGITIYANSNNEKKTIAKKGYFNQIYSETLIKADAKAIVMKELEDEALKEGQIFDLQYIQDFVHQLIEDTYKNQIETLKNMQLTNLLNQSKQD